MVESKDPYWLVLDGYEDEPAAFGVPPYVGFHIRYICGVLEQHQLNYEYITIDQWRQSQHKEDLLSESSLLGVICIAGAVVPGRYLRGTPISQREDKPNAVAWLTKNYSILSDAQICKLVGSTKNTVEAIRNGTYREAVLESKSPMDTGLCTYQDLEKALNRAKNKKDKAEAQAQAEVKSEDEVS